MSEDCREAAGKVGPGNPPEEHRFKPGQSGNPAGRESGSKNIRTILRQLLDMPASDNADITRLEKICAKLVVMAQDGDLASIDRVFDRLEGKPVSTSQLEVANKPGEKFKHECEIIPPGLSQTAELLGTVATGGGQGPLPESSED